MRLTNFQLMTVAWAIATAAVVVNAADAWVARQAAAAWQAAYWRDTKQLQQQLQELKQQLQSASNDDLGKKAEVVE